MTRRELVLLHREAIRGVDLSGRTFEAVRRLLSRRPRRVAIVAAGKSAGPMADAAVRAIRLARVVLASSLVVAPDGCLAARFLRTRRAGHPLPDAQSVRAGRAALALAARLGPGDLLLVLVSGGASAALTAPRPGVTLASLCSHTRRLLASGQGIRTINRARQALCAVKAGGLARAARARVVSVVASDVDGDDPAVVGSGPAAGAPAVVVASPRDLLASALAAARARGLAVRALPSASAPVSVLARRYAAHRGIGIAVGEPTLRVRGRAPGGRAQHLALTVARLAAGRPGFRFLAAGSDGRDGNTENAGACVDGDTWISMKSLGIDTDRVCRSFRATPALEALGLAIPRWPSPVNLQDVHIVVAPP